jgi:hypothetical protein
VNHKNGRIGWSSYATAVPNEGEGPPHEQGGANAHLIAAAPDLLEYAKLEQQIMDFECDHASEDRCNCGEIVEKMVRRVEAMRVAAIAKAEGRE